LKLDTIETFKMWTEVRCGLEKKSKRLSDMEDAKGITEALAGSLVASTSYAHPTYSPHTHTEPIPIAIVYTPNHLCLHTQSLCPSVTLPSEAEPPNNSGGTGPSIPF